MARRSRRARGSRMAAPNRRSSSRHRQTLPGGGSGPMPTVPLQQRCMPPLGSRYLAWQGARAVCSIATWLAAGRGQQQGPCRGPRPSVVPRTAQQQGPPPLQLRHRGPHRHPCHPRCALGCRLTPILETFHAASAFMLARPALQTSHLMSCMCLIWQEVASSTGRPPRPPTNGAHGGVMPQPIIVPRMMRPG